MKRGSGSNSSKWCDAAARTLVAVLLVFPLSAAPQANSSISSQNSGAAGRSVPQSPGESVALVPGAPVERDLTSPGRHPYRFDLAPGQYTTLSVECPTLSATAYLFDGSGAAIDRTYYNLPSTHETLELAAPAGGSFRLEIVTRPVADGGKLCTVELAPSRPATEKELSLQQSRTLIAQGIEMVQAKTPDLAVDKFRKALEIRETLLGSESQLVVHPLAELGNVYLNKADFPQAESFYARALKVQEQVDPNAAPVLLILNNLAIVYINTDRFGPAEQALQRAISLAEKIYGVGCPAAINAMVNLGGLYDDEGDYLKAQEVYERAVAGTEKLFGPDYPGLAVILSNLSSVDSALGDYASAARLAQRAVAILEEPGRPEAGRLALALVALGNAYYFEDKPAQAEPLFERSLKIYEKSLGPEHPLVADNLDNLADVRRQHGDFAQAEVLYRHALEIRQKKLGVDNSAVGTSLNSLANLYQEQRDYLRAEPLYRQALAIREKALGPEHPDVAETLTRLSALRMATGHSADAESLLARAINITEHNADLNLIAGSERQKLAYLRLSAAQLDRAVDLSTSLPGDQRAADLAVTTLLQRKGRVQDVLAENLISLRERLDAEGGSLLDQLDDTTTRLARLVVRGPEDTPVEQYEKKISALKEQREHLEAGISLRSGQFRARAQPVTLDAVRDALPPDSALIEFVSYRKLPVAGVEDQEGSAETHYIAYVIRPARPVEWKELGQVDKLDRSVDAYRRALRDPASKDIKNVSRTLDEELLQPLRPLLKDAHHLLISPDGQLSLMPFEALLDDHNRYVIENHSISYLSTGRDLLRMRVTAPSKTDPLIVADPAFDDAATTQLASARRSVSKNQRRSITAATDLSKVYFAPLPATGEEARSVHILFPKSTVLTGDRATVARLKQTDAPRILHIATHGFFLEDSRIDAPRASQPNATARGLHANLGIENPLLRSGLAFAGANVSRTGKNSGILTALEAANLNLWGTKLVTLSACDTGIGEVRDREGVYGLRRAFVLAGAESLVMSLWPVSDYVTREMMTSYYTGLKHGLGRGEALRQAELAMMKRKGRQHPFYWASFIESGEWANLDGRR